MDSQSKEAQGQGVKKLAKQHLTKKQGVEGGQALRRAQAGQWLMQDGSMRKSGVTSNNATSPSAKRQKRGKKHDNAAEIKVITKAKQKKTQGFGYHLVYRVIWQTGEEVCSSVCCCVLLCVV